MNTLSNSCYTLITGASAGLGKSLSYECAARKRNLILVALPESGLERIQQKLETQFPIKVITYSVDLTGPDAPQRLFDWCKAQELTVDMLINNAGIAHIGFFDSVPPSRHEQVIHLNIRSLVCLTRLFLTELKSLEEAYILNVGSMASFLPIPYKCVYAASKSFVYSFSQGLNQELRGTKVKVSVLCPGPLNTNNKVKARIKAVGIKGKLVTMPPDEVAHIAMTQLFNGKRIIVPGFMNRLFIGIYRMMPSTLAQMVVERIFRKESVNYTQTQSLDNPLPKH